MRRLSSLLSLVILLGLGACSTTVFESVPTGITTDCDPAWPGRWQPVASTGEETKPKDAVEISADCKTITTKDEPKPMRLTLVTTKAGQFLQVHNDDGKPECIGTGKAHCGHALLRYEREGDTIRLYDPNHAQVAADIKKGRIKGFSERADGKEMKTSEPIHRNFIAGDAGKIDKVLRQHRDMFNAEPLIVLQRVTQAPTSTEEAATAAEPVPPTPVH